MRRHLMQAPHPKVPGPAWMRPRLASFGFVVFGIETLSRTDYDTARGTELLAALDYLTQNSAVRDRVDPTRLAVMGHSMGGGGSLYAATQRPSLKAAIGLAPYQPSGNLDSDKVPTLIQGGQNDTTVTPSYLDGLHPTLPVSTPSAFEQLAGAGHLFWTSANNIELRTQIPWLKIFVDNDTRYTQFMCRSLKDTTGVSRYSAKCSLIPSGGRPGHQPDLERSAQCQRLVGVSQQRLVQRLAGGGRVDLHQSLAPSTWAQPSTDAEEVPCI